MEYREEKRLCVICGSDDYRVLRSKVPWTPTTLIKDKKGKIIHQTDVMCSTCGLVYKNPCMVEECLEQFYQDEYATLYKSSMRGQISKKHINQNLLTTIYTLDWLDSIGFGLSGKDVFEIGTGLGILLKGMEGQGAVVSGIDPDKRSIDLAQKLFGLTFDNMTWRDYKGSRNGQYDLLVCNNTLEHMYDPVSVLRQMHVFLKEDGHVLVEVPDIEFPYPHTNVDGFLSAAHLYTFDKHCLRLLVEKAGYEIVHMDNAGHKKCMLVLLKPKKITNFFDCNRDNIDEYFQRVRSILGQMQARSDIIKEMAVELSGDRNVGSIIEKLKEKLPDIYSQCLLSMAANLLEHHRIYDVLECLQEYKDGQPEDSEHNRGACCYFEAMCYRQLGDFLTSRKLLRECTRHYPNIRKYNFVKELAIDGVVSNTGFTEYSWWNAERALQAFG